MNFEISLVSFAVCVALASLLTKTRAFAFLKERKSRFQTLDGLRGFLALSVFFHHFVITYHWKSGGEWLKPDEIYDHNYGKVGVAIFFMITGFLFTAKLLKTSGDIDWLSFFEARFFRIFPLYIFAVLCISLIVFDSSHWTLISSHIDLGMEYLRWAIFHGATINSFSDTIIIIAKVHWSLKYEWLFYMLLPVFSFFLFKHTKWVSLLTVILSVIVFLEPVKLLSFQSQYLLLFVAGGVIAGLIKHVQRFDNIVRSKLTSVVIIFLILASIFYPVTLDFIHVSIIFIYFFLIVLGNNLFGILTSKASLLLGEISYSIYLLHGIVLYVLLTKMPVIDASSMNMFHFSLLMPVMGIIVVLVCSTTFLLVEKPFMTIGRRYLFSTYLQSVFAKKRLLKLQQANK